MEFGYNLKLLRISMKKTQEEIAKSAGFEQSLYAKWEADKSLPGAENLVKLANVFNCSVDYLLGRGQNRGMVEVNNFSIVQKNSTATFTERVTELLAEKHLSRRQLAIHSGIPMTTINNWFNRASLPTLDIAEKLADYFECSLDYLSGRELEDGRIIINRPTEGEKTDIPRELINVYKNLNNRNRKLLCEIANVIARNL